jgi:membrane protein
LWVYFSAQILLVGAEFSCAYARTFGSHKTPDAWATAESKANQ